MHNYAHVWGRWQPQSYVKLLELWREFENRSEFSKFSDKFLWYYLVVLCVFPQNLHNKARRGRLIFGLLDDWPSRACISSPCLLSAVVVVPLMRWGLKGLGHDWWRLFTISFYPKLLYISSMKPSLNRTTIFKLIVHRIELHAAFDERENTQKNAKF